MRSYMKQVGVTHKILIIASPNVQNNFRTQFFDETKLKQENGLWSLNTCIGDALLREINPTNLTDIPKEKVISQMNAIMNNYYSFMGYTEFANYIERHTNVPEDSGVDPEKIRIKKIQKVFNNRLCIIDEVHNIRNTDDNKNKRIAMLLMDVAKHSDGLRLLLLSATPMYNNYKEIIWLVNLMNINDKRPTIKEDQVFDKEGNFIPSQTINGELVEGGRELLERKLIGYVSYVRGENPYTFPYRIYPVDFAPEHTISISNYPKKQMNEKEIAEPLQHIPVYTSQIGEYQQNGYDFIMNNLRNRSSHKYNKTGKLITLPNFENLDAFGYTLLQIPLEALNIVYPNQKMDAILGQETQTMDENQNNEIIDNMIGKIVIILIVIYMFMHNNPILAVLALFVAFDLMRRSSVSTGIDALKRYAPTEEKKSSQFSAFNQFPYTLEQEVVKKMAPIVQSGSSMTKASYKPLLDNLYDASPINQN